MRSSGRRGSRPLRKDPSSSEEEIERLHGALRVLGDAIDHYEETIGEQAAGQGADAAQGPPARGRALPSLRHHDRGRLLLRAPDQLLPEGADRRPGARRTAGSRACSSEAFRPGSISMLKSSDGAEWVRAPIEIEVDARFGDRATVSRSTPQRPQARAPRRAGVLVAQPHRPTQRLAMSMLSSSRQSAPVPSA